MRSWIRRFRRAFQMPPSRTLARRHPLSVEHLEARCLLASSFMQTNLVSDIDGVALRTDPNLINPWGIAFSPTGPFWVADNNAGVSTLYNGAGQIQSLVVTVPPPNVSIATAAPTGIVFNNTSDFVVTANGKSGTGVFIFATEDGTISAWAPAVDGTHAILEVDNSAVPTVANGAVYKGLALGSNAGGNFLFATNFRAGAIDVFDKNFKKVTLAGSFSDPNIPAGFAPFDIAAIGNKLYVTYALQNASKHDDTAGPGNGFVDIFDTNGNLLTPLHLIAHGNLNSPWGLAIAPAGFGTFGGDLLVGNFGDGHINVYDPNQGTLIGQLQNSVGNPLTIDGLWALTFGNGGAAGSPNTLFFTAGIVGEAHGLFGSLQPVTDKPLASAGTNITATEGTAFTGVVAAFTDADPAAKAADFTASITWGDGHTSAGTIAANGSGGFTVTGTNTYAQAGSDAISVTITDTNTTNDPGGSTTTAASTANVLDAALSASGTNVTVNPGLTVNNASVATFTDAGGAQPVANYSATINWGDGSSSSNGTISVSAGTFTVSGGHTYSVPGRFTITTTIHDASGSTTATNASAVIGSPSQRLIAQAYLDLLNRPVDPTGLAFWTSLVDGGTPRAQVIVDIENSQEYRTDVVARLYNLLLHRTPDLDGLNHFVAVLQNGGTVEMVEASIAGSPEYFQKRGGGTNDGFLDAIYKDALNRAVDANGRAGFDQALSHGTSTGAVAAVILGSQEYQMDLVQGLYQQFLHRAADSAGLNAFTSALQQGQRDEAVIAAIVGSDEYFSRL